MDCSFKTSKCRKRRSRGRFWHLSETCYGKLPQPPSRLHPRHQSISSALWPDASSGVVSCPIFLGFCDPSKGTECGYPWGRRLPLRVVFAYLVLNCPPAIKSCLQEPHRSRCKPTFGHLEVVLETSAFSGACCSDPSLGSFSQCYWRLLFQETSQITGAIAAASLHQATWLVEQTDCRGLCRMWRYRYFSNISFCQRQWCLRRPPYCYCCDTAPGSATWYPLGTR